MYYTVFDRFEVKQMDRGYKRTLCASCIGYITQAIVNNLAPLLFVIFQREFEVSVAKIGFLVTYNFCAQITVDFLAAKYAEKIGYKRCIVAAHIFSAVGLIGLGVLPSLLPDPYLGLLLAITVYAVGGGLIEVLVGPIVEALPIDQKSGAMSFLHSFYCWGHALVVILTTVYFHCAGTAAWRLVTILWAVIPAANAVLFAASPILTFATGEEPLSMKRLFSVKIFWVFVLLMLCAGASEQAMSQWASYFAERGLNVDKTLGDLFGPCMFALLMGVSRSVYAAMSSRMSLNKVLVGCGVLCIVSYLLAVFSPLPILSLAGCGLCGFSVGVMWPGVFSLSAQKYPQGGTTMFALLALAGDLGCASGPSTVGVVSEITDGRLQTGLLAAIVFPLLLIIGISFLTSGKGNHN